jgi:hypothetical protein
MQCSILKYKTINKVQKGRNNNCNIPSPENTLWGWFTTEDVEKYIYRLLLGKNVIECENLMSLTLYKA